jgi:hypothetical protein
LPVASFVISVVVLFASKTPNLNHWRGTTWRNVCSQSIICILAENAILVVILALSVKALAKKLKAITSTNKQTMILAKFQIGSRTSTYVVNHSIINRQY